jgi:hypothetical protein
MPGKALTPYENMQQAMVKIRKAMAAKGEAEQVRQMIAGTARNVVDARDALQKQEKAKPCIPQKRVGWTCGRCGGAVSGRYAKCEGCGLDGMDFT